MLRKVGVATALLFGVGVALRLWTADEALPVRSALRLGSLPASVRNIECRSPFTSDVIVTCYFELDPSDFNALLRGWTFKVNEVSRSSHESALWQPIGPKFEISQEYVVHPSEFEHGGHVMIAADQMHHHVIVDLYIE